MSDIKKENLKKSGEPQWIETPPKEKSFRSIFKWGKTAVFKNPSPGFLKVIKKELKLTGRDFEAMETTGDEPVAEGLPVSLAAADIGAIQDIVGEENISAATYDRLKYASGKAMEDLMKLRQARISEIGDLVVHPRDKADVKAVVAYCNDKAIPVHVYGGGSSVTFGLNCPKGGITLVLSTHMNRKIDFNEANQTITVEAGMMGPAYEDLLNRAPEILGAKKAFTCGHFPQSFEFSSVGGWVVALGSGQASSLYGDAADLVISQEYVTPGGSFKTLDYPATATGPKVSEVMKGSEGCYGVLVAVTFKIFEYMPKNNKPFAFMFPDFASAVCAGQQISQGRFGMPAIFRISDAEETDVALQMYGLEGGLLDKFLNFRQFQKGQRCIIMGQTEGEKGFSANVLSRVKKIARQNKGLYLTGYPMKKWYHGRFSDPYMRDALNDYGVLIDTLECSVTWDNIHPLHQQVRAVVKSNPQTICMTHASHFYAQGTNLYFIFITKMKDLDDFRVYQGSIIDAIEKAGGSLSHHHGVGRMMAPWMEKHLGKEQMGVLRAVKAHLDPKGIMNPGGLGL